MAGASQSFVMLSAYVLVRKNYSCFPARFRWPARKGKHFWTLVKHNNSHSEHTVIFRSIKIYHFEWNKTQGTHFSYNYAQLWPSTIGHAGHSHEIWNESFGFWRVPRMNMTTGFHHIYPVKQKPITKELSFRRSFLITYSRCLSQ